MKFELSMDLPIKAEPINDHYGLKHDRYDVKEIHMGQTNTSIELMGFGDKSFNSVHFRFWLHNSEIDIYGSGLINTYSRLRLPMICYKRTVE